MCTRGFASGAMNVFVDGYIYWEVESGAVRDAEFDMLYVTVFLKKSFFFSYSN